MYIFNTHPLLTGKADENDPDILLILREIEGILRGEVG
jgi:hypothetical protein